VKQLLATLTELEDKVATLELMDRLLRLDPLNPTVFDDCIIYAVASGGSVNCTDLLGVFEALKTEYTHDAFVQANCEFYAGRVLINTDPVLARKHLTQAQTAFRKLLPRGHQVFTVLRSTIRQLSHEKPVGPSAVGLPKH
jgi:hypothetical protein